MSLLIWVNDLVTRPNIFFSTATQILQNWGHLPGLEIFMKAVGLITEYNPFHNGHLYHLREAVKMTQADVCIAVMSGNFVQRGEPAMIHKYARCRAAVDCGVNLVVELPSFYALSSAEFFADGAVQVCDALAVSSLVFGSECGELTPLQAAADILVREPDDYRQALKNALATGKTFPQARQESPDTLS